MPELLTPQLQRELLAFTQSLVRIKSYSGEEEEIIRCIEPRMRELGYDEVRIDAMGNLIGRIGNGPRSILFDSHVDTVAVTDAEAWVVPPFSGRIEGGFLHGRGSVDMKSSVAASIYAGAIAKQRGWTRGKTIYVSCTVFEEDCDGENLKHLFQEFSLRPDAVVICEPSSNRIYLGHKGKAQVAITTHGVSAHGSAPDQGQNAVYEMAEIIQRVDRLNQRLATQQGPSGTVVLSRISSAGASLNAVPTACEIYLDRRLALGETKAQVSREMEELIAGKNASWAIGTLHRTCWTGLEIQYEPFHDPWRIETDHPLTQALVAAYQAATGAAPPPFGFWDFSTNAVTPVSLGIPTIGFGPGDYKLAHMRDERCATGEILGACGVYARLMGGGVPESIK
jgi:putative selenium metabolism hydrolase